MSVEDFLNKILNPYKSILITNKNLRYGIENIVTKYHFEFDTQQTRDNLEKDITDYITNFIVDERDEKINRIFYDSIHR